LELLAVLTVIGALLFFAIPRYAVNRQSSPEAVEATITGAIRATRQTARRTGTIAKLAIEQLQERIPKGYELAIDDSEASAELVFFPLGNANGTRWRLEADDLNRLILVDPLTGRVHVEEG